MTSKHARPTSPHLQIYKLPLTGIISITHRITGVLLSAGLVLVVMLFYTLAQGTDAYQAAQSFLNLWYVKVIYWGFIYALFFHFSHGVRHLVWDVGVGFAADKLHVYALIELGAAFVLTLTTWLIL